MFKIKPRGDSGINWEIFTLLYSVKPDPEFTDFAPYRILNLYATRSFN